jgi:hypothetical protein
MDRRHVGAGPCLAINVPVTFAHIPGERDMLALRRYHRPGEPSTALSYADILDAYFDNGYDDLEKINSWSELSSAELVPIVREMIDRVRSPERGMPRRHARFMELNRLFIDRLAERRSSLDWFGCAKPGTAVPDAYCEINPGFL